MTKISRNAAKIVQGIVSDLTDRRGLKHEWYNIDEDIINKA